MWQKDTGIYQSPTTIVKFFTDHRREDKFGWLSTKQIQEGCLVRRDVLLQILIALYRQGTIEKCGVMGHKKLYRLKVR